jgi:hypothetical protein
MLLLVLKMKFEASKMVSRDTNSSSERKNFGAFDEFSQLQSNAQPSSHIYQLLFSRYAERCAPISFV